MAAISRMPTTTTSVAEELRGGLDHEAEASVSRDQLGGDQVDQPTPRAMRRPVRTSGKALGRIT